MPIAVDLGKLKLKKNLTCKIDGTKHIEQSSVLNQELCVQLDRFLYSFLKAAFDIEINIIFLPFEMSYMLLSTANSYTLPELETK